MDKKLLLSVLASAGILFIGGGLLFGILLSDLMAEYMAAGGACMNDPMPMLPIVLANVTQAILLSLIINKFGIRSFSSGALTGGWITLLMILWMDLWLLSSFNFMTSKLLILDIFSNTLLGALAGGAIGWILGKVN